MYQIGDGVEKNPLEAFNIFKNLVQRNSDVQPNSPDWQFSADALVALINKVKAERIRHR